MRLQTSLVRDKCDGDSEWKEWSDLRRHTSVTDGMLIPYLCVVISLVCIKTRDTVGYFSLNAIRVVLFVLFCHSNICILYANSIRIFGSLYVAFGR